MSKQERWAHEGSAGGGTAQPHPVGLVGSTVGQGYLIDRVLGQGAMGIVVRAYREDMQRFVAIKLISKELGSDETFKNRFAREIKATAALQHPNVVTVYDTGFTEDGQAYLVMEYLRGVLLRDVLIAAAPLPWRRAVGLMRQMSAGMGAAHAQGIFHRDLKPENIFVSSVLNKELVTVADFGLARLQDQSDELTEPGMTLGSPDYLAPEAIDAADLNSDQDFSRVDVFSMGCIFFELLTGELPLCGVNLVATLVKRLTGGPAEWTAKSMRDVPSKLRELVDSMLRRDPGTRPVDAVEVLGLLDAFLGEQGDTSPSRSRTHLGLGRLVPPPVQLRMASANVADQSAESRTRLGRGLLALPNDTTAVVLVRAVDWGGAHLSVFVGSGALTVGAPVDIAFPTRDAAASSIMLRGTIGSMKDESGHKVDCRWDVVPQHVEKFRQLLKARGWD